jgi:hypothetical protein
MQIGLRTPLDAPKLAQDASRPPVAIVEGQVSLSHKISARDLNLQLASAGYLGVSQAGFGGAAAADSHPGAASTGGGLYPQNSSEFSWGHLSDWGE